MWKGLCSIRLNTPMHDYSNFKRRLASATICASDPNVLLFKVVGHLRFVLRLLTAVTAL